RASPSAISSRSASDRYRPDTGPGPFPFTPPATRNQRRAPSALPATAAASPGASPDRTRSQNRSRTTRGISGRPFSTTPTTTSTTANRCNHQLNPPALDPGFHGVPVARFVRAVVLEIREWLLGVRRLQPAVHLQHGSGEVGAGGRGQVQHGGGYVINGAQPAERRGRLDPRPE